MDRAMESQLGGTFRSQRFYGHAQLLAVSIHSTGGRDGFLIGGKLREPCMHLLLAIVTKQGQGDLGARWGGGDAIAQSVGVVDALAVDRRENVAGANPRSI